ncbi:MAG TPA: hypothetical protein VJ184_13060 [Chryseolinea sp.]|nr:hypothetical protein [Chryseolinea sp.]
MSVSDEEFIDLIQKNGVRKTSIIINRNIRNVNRRRRKLEEKYGPINRDASVNATSTLYDAEGNTILQWVKRKAEREEQEKLLNEIALALSEKIPKVTPTPPPKHTEESLLNFYITTDYHLGMLSWREESGDDWDIKIAESLLLKWYGAAIKMAPDAKIGILAQLGDMLHFDGMEAVTPENKNILDADTRFQKVVRVAIRVLRQIIQMLLKKHEHLHIIMADANHDPASSAWLREMMHVMYEDEPRITVDRSADTYYCYEFGNTSIFVHHGHKRKPSNIDDVFVAKFREVFGRTKYSYAHMGHMHHLDSRETNLMIVTQHRTLAAKDAYASRGGYMAGRSADVITYSEKYGEVGRITITPEMVK